MSATWPTTQDAFAAWAADQEAGLDALMLAPTRDLVADLNQRARTTASMGKRRVEKRSCLTGTRPLSGM